MNKNACAQTPPMGWNSWDCYGASVTEQELRQNIDYMAEHLKSHGWEYIVCDIQWYEPTANSSHYHKFADLCMDEYGRLCPAPNRFPSAADGSGFTKIAAYAHEKGLKFGIHIMRGIPRQAVSQNVKIKNSIYTAREAAHPSSICCWNTDMYGLDATKPGAQDYYDSILELYASWGVDLIKVDDICVKYGQINNESTLAYGGDEIQLLRHAIDKCGRPVVLSLSPVRLWWSRQSICGKMPICGGLPTICGIVGKILWKCLPVVISGALMCRKAVIPIVICCR